MYIQQGDCLLKQTKIPSDLEIVKTDLLHKGENHHHRVRGAFEIAQKMGKRFLLSNGCEIYHEEHKTLSIPEGCFELSFVQEYDHWLEESRAVVD